MAEDRDAIREQLMQRIDDLEAEKSALVEENEALASENITLRNECAEIRRQLVTMRCA